MTEVIPAILTDDPRELEEKIHLAEGISKRVHIDIIDGVFANNKTVSLDALAGIDTDLLIDVHLMTKEPVLWVEHAVRAMADRVIGQIEMMGSAASFVEKCQEVGLQIGLGIDLNTKVESVEPTILRDMDLVLVMGVKAGFGGQDFDESVLDKIKKLDEVRSEGSMKFRICVDGGINKETVKLVRQQGADEVAVGGAIYKAPGGDVGQNMKELMEVAYQ